MIVVGPQIEVEEAVLPILILLLFIICKVAAIAIEKKKLLHFWQATFAYFLLFVLVVVEKFPMRLSDGISQSVILGLGLMLSIVPLYRGNWATRIYALPAFALYCEVIYRTLPYISSWKHITEYWIG